MTIEQMMDDMVELQTRVNYTISRMCEVVAHDFDSIIYRKLTEDQANLVFALEEMNKQLDILEREFNKMVDGLNKEMVVTKKEDKKEEVK